MRFAAPLLLAQLRWTLGRRRPPLGGRPIGAPPVHAECGLRDVFAAVPLHTMSPAPPAVTLDGRKRDGNFTNIQYMVILPISTGNQTHTRQGRLQKLEARERNANGGPHMAATARCGGGRRRRAASWASAHLNCCMTEPQPRGALDRQSRSGLHSVLRIYAGPKNYMGRFN